uniref:Trehalase n=1 Tax=Ascaris suum TaxID=6253 RepID=F1KU03_ASCSU
MRPLTNWILSMSTILIASNTLLISVATKKGQISGNNGDSPKGTKRMKSIDNENFDDLQHPSDRLIPTMAEMGFDDNRLPRYVCNQSDSRASIIYCEGELLHAVMMLHLYVDSKTYVDKPLKKNPEEVMEAFKRKFRHPLKYGDREKLRAFMEENFDRVGDELLECKLPDWQPRPFKLLNIRDPHLRKFALEINEIWSRLCRKMKPEVKRHPEKRSLIYVPNHFVVPGGRFREFYYWDTYWIIKGLLACHLYETTRAMLDNFKYLVNKIGFIPNGGRLYYLRRSQPPFFIPMVFEYYRATKDKKFLSSILPAMRKEFEFWTSRRMVDVELNGKTHQVFQYRAESNVPRPESYREDFETARMIKPSKKHILWTDIASAAESGWDFSSRWFADHKRLTTIVTTKIIPVDLNAILCWNMGILAYLYNEIGNKEEHNHFRERHERFMETFKEVFYDEDEGAWYDFYLPSGIHNDAAFPSMAIPLFTQCYDRLDYEMGRNVLHTLQRRGLLQFPGGVPTSIKKGTAQQWDYPNGWAPINHMLIEGLRKSGDPELQQIAFELATRWLSRNYHVYMAENIMWEKYDVSKKYIRKARGGEYENQEGFGWTNGVALDLMVSYANQMEVIPFGIENTTLDYTDEELDYGCASAHATLISFTLITTVVLLNVLHLQV